MEIPFDQEIRDLLEDTYQQALLIPSTLTPDQIRLLMVATNLESIAKTFLKADSDPTIKVNLKKMALGILGTQDWIKEGL